MIVFLLIFLCFAEDFSSWAAKQRITPIPEKNYHTLADMYKRIAALEKEKPGVIESVRIGMTGNKRTIWGFRIQEPARDIRVKVLVFAGLHPLEWISNETAMAIIEELVAHPINHVSVLVIPCVNIDRRLLTERELRTGSKKYRRSNGNGVDLNRDYEIHRDSDSIWKNVVPEYYTVSPQALSQPESKALDSLADKERFDAVVSLHSFGGYIFYPWAGRWKSAPDAKRHHHLANIMSQAQRHPFPYKAMQLSKWGFPFRTLGTELDHFYGKYGSLTFLIELTRSGLFPLSPKSFQNPFRWYNPRNPQKDIERGVDSVLALARQLGMEKWTLDNSHEKHNFSPSSFLEK